MIAPILFSLFYFNQKEVFTEKVKLLFFKILHWSNVLFMLVIGIFYLKIKYVDLNGDYGYFLSHLERKLPLLNDHPIYISIIFSVSILFTINYVLSKKTTVKFNWIYGGTSVLLFLLILFLSRRGVIFALIISAISIILFSYKNNIKQIIKTTVGILVVVSALLFFIPQTNKRISEMLNETTYSTKNETNSTNNRLQIYKCAFDLIKEQPFFGYGIEDDRRELYQCYKENLYYLYELKFNTHNQYLSILMKVGIIGLLLFLWFLYYNLRMALKTKDCLFVGSILFFSIVMMFENILERQNGIMLFTFLINYFAFKNYLLLHEPNEYHQINVQSKELSS
jgi:O-antigen ligase